MSIVSLKDVIKHRPACASNALALDSISLEFKEGEFSALLGPSGSAKSAVIDIIAGLDTIASGQIHVCGHELSALDAAQKADLRKSEIGVVHKSHNVAEHLTIRQNLLLAHSFNGLELDKELFDDVVARFDLAQWLSKMPKETDVDVHQRTAIARAVLKGSTLILADEPAAQLGSRATEAIMDCLRTCTREYGRSVIVATHNSFAAAYADRVFLLLDGAFKGTIESPTIQSIFFAQENLAGVRD